MLVWNELIHACIGRSQCNLQINDSLAKEGRWDSFWGWGCYNQVLQDLAQVKSSFGNPVDPKTGSISYMQWYAGYAVPRCHAKEKHLANIRQVPLSMLRPWQDRNYRTGRGWQGYTGIRVADSNMNEHEYSDIECCLFLGGFCFINKTCNSKFEWRMFWYKIGWEWRKIKIYILPSCSARLKETFLTRSLTEWMQAVLPSCFVDAAHTRKLQYH